MTKKIFLIELSHEPFDSSVLKHPDIELVSSVFEAEAVIVDGGFYCRPSSVDGWKTLIAMVGHHPTKHFWMIDGHGGPHKDIVEKNLTNATFLSRSEFDPSKL